MRTIDPIAALCLLLMTLPAFAQTCRLASAPVTRPLVELYTSEGCNSCPPADRWLARQFPATGADARAVALAFHVDYWDRLGWVDRFGSAANTERQYAAMRANGGTFVYTPQVLLQGRDLPGWQDGTSAIAAAAGTLARATIVVEAGIRSGARLTADAALELSRPVGAVPGPIDAEQCAGTNMMLRDGAIVIASVDDAIALLGADAPSSAARNSARNDGALLRPLQPVDDAAARILAAIGRGARNVDALVDATSLTARDVLGGVSALELRGLVRRDASGLALF